VLFVSFPEEAADLAASEKERQMKVGLIASFLIHLGALALVPSREPPRPARAQENAAASCRCDYEFTITDTRPPRALTLGEVPADRFRH
jgi:hypothetical protein